MLIHAQYFQVEYHNAYKVVRTSLANETYVLLIRLLMRPLFLDYVLFGISALSLVPIIEFPFRNSVTHICLSFFHNGVHLSLPNALIFPVVVPFAHCETMTADIPGTPQQVMAGS